MNYLGNNKQFFSLHFSTFDIFLENFTDGVLVHVVVGGVYVSVSSVQGRTDRSFYLLLRALSKLLFF